MKKLLTGIRLALLVAALAVVGVGMLPANSAADHATCSSVNCGGGTLLCNILVHGDGTIERCYQPKIP